MLNVHSPSHRAGFTIVELLVVIVVIAILASITIVAYNGIQNRANDTAVQSDITNLYKKIEIFNTTAGRYPNTTEISTIGFNASTGSYAISPTTAHNLMYCFQSGGSNADYAVVGLSKSGNAYYASNKSGGLKPYTAGWSTNSITPCTNIDPILTTNWRGYVSTETPTWRSWTRGGQS
ncbi:prepilin-type N-terminal cleavage/methylation domain-containing protein [Candidatus Saccharibacteria bacterium]|nr:prepilin-type N-terminal cleavage/methylation domain-containing protein [Candidatus Saccharibacteria bacterium]